MIQIGGSGIFSALFALENIHRARDVAGDVNVVIVFEETAQSIARVFLIIDDQERRLD